MSLSRISRLHEAEEPEDLARFFSREVGVGVIGLGIIGRQHVASYRWANARGCRNRLVAVCDPDPDRRAGLSGPRGNLEAAGAPKRFLDPDKVRGYRNADDLLADDEVELVSICTWTETHVPLAIAALEAGKHVLVEKPLAISSLAVQPLAAAALRAGTLCMPAMCMRFWPAWRWLREIVERGTLGAARRASFTRVATHPGPLHAFYGDEERSGGALFDLHVHDTDFVRWLFGAPQAVFVTGTPGHLTAIYHYARGPAEVLAESGWDLPFGEPFRMRFSVVFEKATVDFDIQREPTLMIEWTAPGGYGAADLPPERPDRRPVAVPPGTGYDHEVCAMLAAVASGTSPDNLPVTIPDAHAVLLLLEAERESLRTGRRVML